MVVRTVVPDVAVTRTWKVPAGVNVDAPPLDDPPPPQPATVSTPTRSASAGTSTARRRTPRLNFCCVSNIRNSTAARKLASAYSHSMGGDGRWNAAGGAKAGIAPPGPVVKTQSVTVIELPLGVCVGWGNSAATPCGKQVAGATAVAQKVIGPVKPLGPGVTVIGKVASCPGCTTTGPLGPAIANVTPVPVSVTVCAGTGAPLGPAAPSKMLSVAGPREPVADGVKDTPMVHVPPTATGVAVEQVVDAATIEKSVALAPVIVGAPVKVSGPPPMLVRVTVCAGLALPTPWLAKVSALVERLTRDGVAPDRAMVCVPGVALSVIVAVATRAPLADGVNVKTITHEVPACKLVSTVHVVPCATAKSPAFAPMMATFELMFSVAVPELVSVMVSGALVVLSGVAGNAALVGFSVTAGPFPAPIRGTICVEPATAPESSVMVNEAVSLPAIVAVNVTAMAQVASGRT